MDRPTNQPRPKNEHMQTKELTGAGLLAAIRNVRLHCLEKSDATSRQAHRTQLKTEDGLTVDVWVSPIQSSRGTSFELGSFATAIDLKPLGTTRVSLGSLEAGLLELREQYRVETGFIVHLEITTDSGFQRIVLEDPNNLDDSEAIILGELTLVLQQVYEALQAEDDLPIEYTESTISPLLQPRIGTAIRSPEQASIRDFTPMRPDRRDDWLGYLGKWLKRSE